MSDDNPTPDPESATFWPELVKWQTREAAAANRRGWPEHAQQWRDSRAQTVQHWADSVTYLPDGSATRGRRGR